MATAKKKPETEPFKARLHRMLAEVGTIAKASSPQLKYAFLSYDDMAPAVRDAATRCGVVPELPEVEILHHGTIKMRNGEHQHAVVRAVYKYSDAFGDESCVYVAVGEGADAYDKALNKAQTAAWKNAHKFGFLVATGDQSDSEYDQTSEASGRRSTASATSSQSSEPRETASPGFATTGQFLRSAREGSNITLKAVAEMLGLSVTQVSALETGKVDITAERRDRYLKALADIKRGAEGATQPALL
jgi:DNA-binding transcriptional regulator YiaG